jgi:hypothetical protein
MRNSFRSLLSADNSDLPPNGQTAIAPERSSAPIAAPAPAEPPTLLQSVYGTLDGPGEEMSAPAPAQLADVGDYYEVCEHGSKRGLCVQCAAAKLKSKELEIPMPAGGSITATVGAPEPSPIVAPEVTAAAKLVEARRRRKELQQIIANAQAELSLQVKAEEDARAAIDKICQNQVHRPARSKARHQHNDRRTAAFSPLS